MNFRLDLSWLGLQKKRCFTFHLIGAHFRDELKYLGDASKQKKKCGPIRTLEITGMILLDELLAKKLLTENHEIKPEGFVFQRAFYTSEFFLKKLW